MTKTLTEQWRDGTLESGMYHWKLPNNETFMATLYKMDEYKQTKDASQIVCLAPVPSYEELREKEVIYNTTSRCNETLLWENESLKKKLEIATKALKEYANCKPTEWMTCVTADKALKEMEGVK